MLETLKRLLSPEYLVVADPGPLGALGVLYVLLALGFAFGAAASVRALLLPATPSGRTAGLKRALAWFELCVCTAGLAALAGRALGWPGWASRAWPLAFSILALAGALAFAIRLWRPPHWLTAQLRILSLSPVPVQEPQESRKPWLQLALLCVHLGGMVLVVVGWYRLSPWLLPALVVLLLIPQALLLLIRRTLTLAPLTPLFGAYLATLLAVAYRYTGITIVGWQGLEFPNPYLSVFYTDGIIMASVTYALLCQATYTSSALNRPVIGRKWIPVFLLVVTAVWCGVVYFGKRTHGAAASDPYAYTQMAVDLATRGTFLHRYDLFQDASSLGIAWAPLQPVGYHVPRNALGDSASVWATGASVLLAAGYWLAGETGLYVAIPVIALLSLCATWVLVQEVLRHEPRPVRYLTAALTIGLVATSPEQVDRLLVPMADAAAQLFTVLTLVCALRTSRLLVSDASRVRVSHILTGVFLGWAYWVRHTQLVLAFAVALAIVAPAYRRQVPWRRCSVMLLVVAGAALVAAAPDIAYRWRVFGAPWAVESTELASMSVLYVGTVSQQLLREVLTAGEWGYLFPLALYGTYLLARRRRLEMAVLGMAFAAVVFVHLTYRYLRLRDLIPLFPLVALVVAFGAVELARQARHLATQPALRDRIGPMLVGAACIGWIILSLALSRWAMIDRMWLPGWASFGYMDLEARAAMDRLASLTRPGAVVAASLNAGAIALYADRDPVRPYDAWSAEDWNVFVRAMNRLGRRIYLLDDGKQMSAFIDQTSLRYDLVPIEALPVPLFGVLDRRLGWLYLLELP